MRSGLEKVVKSDRRWIIEATIHDDRWTLTAPPAPALKGQDLHVAVLELAGARRTP